MKFQKGNKLAKGGAREGAGRKKSPKAQLIEAVEGLDEKIPGVLDKLVEMALEGHEKAAEYIVDRRLGRPLQGVNITDRERALERVERLAELYNKPSEQIAEGEFKQLPEVETGKELLEQEPALGDPRHV